MVTDWCENNGSEYSDIKKITDFMNHCKKSCSNADFSIIIIWLQNYMDLHDFMGKIQIDLNSCSKRLLPFFFLMTEH